MRFLNRNRHGKTLSSGFWWRTEQRVGEGGLYGNVRGKIAPAIPLWTVSASKNRESAEVAWPFETIFEFFPTRPSSRYPLSDFGTVRNLCRKLDRRLHHLTGILRPSSVRTYPVRQRHFESTASPFEPSSSNSGHCHGLAPWLYPPHIMWDTERPPPRR